jgi:magnesium chelatase accessory protein
MTIAITGATGHLGRLAIAALKARGQKPLALVRDPAHVDGTLGMMAQWKLEDLMTRLPAIKTPTLLIASTGDLAVPARISRDAARHMPAARYAELPTYGHLIHEEAPESVAALLLPFLAAPGSA